MLFKYFTEIRSRYKKRTKYILIILGAINLILIIYALFSINTARKVGKSYLSKSDLVKHEIGSIFGVYYSFSSSYEEIENEHYKRYYYKVQSEECLKCIFEIELINLDSISGDGNENWVVKRHKNMTKIRQY